MNKPLVRCPIVWQCVICELGYGDMPFGESHLGCTFNSCWRHHEAFPLERIASLIDFRTEPTSQDSEDQVLPNAVSISIHVYCGAFACKSYEPDTVRSRKVFLARRHPCRLRN